MILLIEDDEVDRELVQRLMPRNYPVRVAASGAEGIAASETKQPRLVLLDYWLPDIDSTKLLKEFVAKDIPVIMLTGERNPNVIVGVMREGAKDYLLKDDLTQESLEWAVARALELAELHRNIEEQQRQLQLQDQRLSEQNRRIRALASALTLAEQRERVRVSHILHDHIQQLLYSVQMNIHLAITDSKNELKPEALERLGAATDYIEEAIGVTRTLSVDLSPRILSDEGLGAALRWLSNHMKRVHGLEVDLQIESDLQVESQEFHVLIIQMVQELLFNVVKHSNVLEARVRLYCEDGKYKIKIEDEGAGFDSVKAVPPIWKPRQGYGLYSVRERLKLLNGSLEIDSHPGNGASLTIVLPPEQTLEPSL